MFQVRAHSVIEHTGRVCVFGRGSPNFSGIQNKEMLQVSIWHKKKPDIDELESIAKLKLAEASSLKLTKHNGRLRCCKECTTEMDKFEEECAMVVEETCHMFLMYSKICDLLHGNNLSLKVDPQSKEHRPFISKP
ncbi:Uncharacterized protein Rs2_03213 [Raphanus sativus]|nr:Uncharacterized protein Rs2_46381 [Raphanus sativus]KAJ4878647.1 hypothetical protein Rs2_43665 [Raphanus sativus]KAJ4917663.1 Uncharacterized protein Rs2_03213 [Raphanus sativus]